MRAVAEIVEERNTTQIVVSEIPYQTAVESIDKQVADAIERVTCRAYPLPRISRPVARPVTS